MNTMQRLLAAALCGLAGYSVQAVPTIDTQIVVTPGNPYSHHHLLLSLLNPDPDITQVQWEVDGVTGATFISTQLPNFLLDLGYVNGQVGFFSPEEHAVDAHLWRNGSPAETLSTTYTPTGNEVIPDAGSTAALGAIGVGALAVLKRRTH